MTPGARTARARDLRRRQTHAEALLWQYLRAGRLAGFRFRRQHPIGHFITDFYCAPARLVIEIDGDTHAEPDQAEYDAARTTWPEAQGYRVIRFQNADVHRRLESALDAVRLACERHSRHSNGAARRRAALGGP